MSARVQLRAALVRRKRQAARLADAEIRHLEVAVKYALQHDDCRRIVGLDKAYWCKRILTIGDTYDLVPSQMLRLKGLLRLLDGDQDGRARRHAFESAAQRGKAFA
jgi:hypothetical protein